MTTARHNPFAMHRIHSIRYMPQTCTWPELLERLRTMEYRGAIVGPEGSGKTTLLEDLGRHLAEEGRTCRSIFITLDVKVPPREIRAAVNAADYDILLIDGADHLHPLVFGIIEHKTARGRKGLVITSHRPNLLPTLIECHTSPDLFGQIVETLAPSGDCPENIAAVYHKHKGNIRDALRELYDLTALK